ncbi:MAG: PIN domain nuclease [Bacteroidetes bacterium]|nr:PIN domain nuclease [Bacteroidota bacterium]
MILIDSSVLIDHFNGTKNLQTNKLNDLLGREVVVIGDYILAEVLQGFRSNKDYREAKSILRAFPCLELCGIEIAEKSAENFRKLRKKGITIRKTIDVIIATFCIENDISLLHIDNDFLLFQKHLGLKSVL